MNHLHAKAEENEPLQGGVIHDFICKMFTNNNMPSDQRAVYTVTTVAMRVVNNNRRRRGRTPRGEVTQQRTARDQEQMCGVLI